MSYFDELLKKRNLTECPLPLWKLKITQTEYDELKQQLEQLSHRPTHNCPNPFITHQRECALFYAEYWRREYKQGLQSRVMVYQAIHSTRDIDFSNGFFVAAKRGAERLGIERLSDAGGAFHWFESMLYQGGLPIKKVIQEKGQGRWERFVKGLVNQRIDFVDLDLGQLAQQSNSLSEFCECLMHGIDKDQYAEMPFYCKDDNAPEFLFFKKLVHDELQHQHNRQRQQHPFEVNWEFSIDRIGGEIQADYIFKGPKKLPYGYVATDQPNPKVLRVYLAVNGKSVASFEYVGSYCRYNVKARDKYQDGNLITMSVNDEQTLRLSTDLDLTIPHILCLDSKTGRYTVSKGNKIGESASVLLIPEGWSVEDDKGLPTTDCSYCDAPVRVMDIPADFADEIVVTNEVDGSITFGRNKPLYRTELKSAPLSDFDILENVYDAGRCQFLLCNDAVDGEPPIITNRIEYRGMWEREWHQTAPYGKFYARAIAGNGCYVASASLKKRPFVNIGNSDDLAISVVEAYDDTCRIRVAWEHGTVTAPDGECVYGNDNVWEFRKNKATENGIRFTLTPHDCPNNRFDITVKAPFRTFAILDNYGKPVTSGSLIPYSDLDKYQYRIVMDARFRFGTHQDRRLYWQNDSGKLRRDYVNAVDVHRADHTDRIPYEGSLPVLFGSLDEVKRLLERTSRNMYDDDAKIPVSFCYDNGRRFNFTIKEMPYRVEHRTDGTLAITSNGEVVNYRANLKLLKLDDPKMLAETAKWLGSYEGYVLPETVRSWGKVLVAGSDRGRVCPAMIDPTHPLTDEDRADIRKTAIAEISESLQNARLGGETWQRIIGWFDMAQKEDIPAGSLLDLVCVGNSATALLCIAFQLYCDDERDKVELAESLKAFSDDLAFSWHWLHSNLDGLYLTLTRYMEVNNKFAKNLFVQWAVSQDNIQQCLMMLGDENQYIAAMTTQCLPSVITEFTSWMKSLCVDSLCETYNGAVANDFFREVAEGIVNDNAACIERRRPRNGEEYSDEDIENVRENQNDIETDEACEFFNRYAVDGVPVNENWLRQRVNAVKAQLNGEIDLFAQTDEIRRSIIYCTKSYTEQFIQTLNNKLN